MKMRFPSGHRRRAAWGVSIGAALVAAVAFVALPASAGPGNVFSVHNIVSDGFSPADKTDGNLVNAWGLVANATSPWWIAANGTDVSTIYGADGTTILPPVSVPGAPTGIVVNGGAGFVVSAGGGSGPARFLFATEDGTILGWNAGVPPPPVSKQATQAVPAHDGAIYKSLAIASTHQGDFLYAADFHNARIDVFDSSFAPAGTPGAFVDPNLPEGYAPFGIRNLGGTIFVAYAKQDKDAEDEIAGPGFGFVDAFDTAGNFLGRVASRGKLNAPWGLAIAPHGFGPFGGDLLVGNFGDGLINAYTRDADGHWVHHGLLRDAHGRPISIDGLWGISFGNDAAAGPSSTLFFAAGPHDEQHGLFGSIVAGA